jgi:hypothetical protein
MSLISTLMDRSRLTTRARPILGGALSLMAIQATSAQTIDEFRNKFKEGVRRECLVTQRNAAENRNLSDGLLVRYCDCVASHSTEVLTIQEIMQVPAGPSRETQLKLNALGKTCIEMIQGVVRDAPIAPGQRR